MSPVPLRHLFRSAAAAITLFAMGTAVVPVVAQDAYPGRPIRVVVPYLTGGVSDAVARLVLYKLSERLKTPVVVENIAGANGQLGSANVARAAPDGYNLLVVVAAHAINPSLYPKMAYAPLQDLSGVSLFGHIPLLLVSSAQLPPTTLKDYLTWARENPKLANFASSGAGSAAHLTAELLAQASNVALTHVPYKGISNSLPDLFSGQVSLIFDSVQTMMTHVRSGKLRALAITSSKRWPAIPEVPTIAEAGFPSLIGGSWVGLLAPSRTPRAIVNQLSTEVQAVLNTPEVHAKLIEYGVDPVGGTPAAFDSFIQQEQVRWGAVIKKANITLE